jgi:hypothetical protein
MHFASDDAAVVRQTIRPLIEKIVVQPRSARGGKSRPIQRHGNVYRMLAFAGPAYSPNAKSLRGYFLGGIAK